MDAHTRLQESIAETVGILARLETRSVSDEQREQMHAALILAVGELEALMDHVHPNGEAVADAGEVVAAALRTCRTKPDTQDCRPGSAPSPQLAA